MPSEPVSETLPKSTAHHKRKRSVANANAQSSNPAHPDKGNSDHLDNTNSTKSSRPQKLLRRDERRDLLTCAKDKWEALRPRAVAKDKAAKLGRELHNDLKGRLSDIVFRHDGSRIIQWLLSAADKNVRSAVVDELLADVNASPLSKDPSPSVGGFANSPLFARMVADRYAKHVAIKIMRTAPSNMRTRLFETQILPHVSTLVRVAPSAVVLDVAFATLLNSASRAHLTAAILFSRQPRHWQHIRQSLFPPNRDASLKQDHTSITNTDSVFSRSLDALPAEFHNVILESAGQVVEGMLEKETLLSMEFVHVVVKEYIQVLMSRGDADKARVISVSIASNVVHFAHTRPGMVVCLWVIKILDAKHRKKVVRSMEGHFRELLMDDFGHRVVMGLVEWMDDTRLVGKILAGEVCSTGGGRVVKGTDQKGDTPDDEQKNDKAGDLENGVEQGKQGRSRGGRSRAEKKGKVLEIADKEGHHSSNGGTDVDWIIQAWNHKYGRMIFLNLLVGRERRYFNPEVYGIVWQRIDENTFGRTSKKDEDVRRKELRDYIAKPIRDVVQTGCSQLVTSICGSGVLVAASSNDEMKDAVGQGVARMLSEDGGLKRVCELSVAKRGLGTVFKVGGRRVQVEVMRRVGDDVQKALTSEGIWTRDGSGSEDDDAMADDSASNGNGGSGCE